MKRNLLVSAAAVVCLAWPATVLADPPADHGQGGAQQGGAQQADHGKDGAHGKAATGQGGSGGQGHGGQAQGGQAQRGQAQAGQAQGAQGQGGRGQGGRGQGGRQAQGAFAGGQAQGRSPSGSGGQGGQPQFQVRRGATQGGRSAVTGVQTQQTQGLTTYRQVRQSAGHPPANQPVLSGWTSGITGSARDQAGQQWRTAHSGLSNNAVWRGNSNWWRGNSAFRLWGGERLGFFFIPELGYVSVPAAYQVRYWRAGEMLPNWFWRYAVRDYWSYGLPQPPDGCAWVWVDNDVALVDLSDGYILDIEHNIW